jgi:non-specific serine/threonine protein kinase
MSRSTGKSPWTPRIQDLQTGSYQHGFRQGLSAAPGPGKEAALINKLTSMNFQARSPDPSGFWNRKRPSPFLLDAYPEMVQEYRMFGEQSLNRYKVRLADPEVVAILETQDDKAEDKWFNLDISVDYDGERVPIDKIWKAWTQGKRYVQLKDGSYTRLPESWLKTLGHRLETLGIDPDKPSNASSSSSRPRSWTKSWKTFRAHHGRFLAGSAHEDPRL